MVQGLVGEGKLTMTRWQRTMAKSCAVALLPDWAPTYNASLKPEGARVLWRRRGCKICVNLQGAPKPGLQ